MLAVDELSNAYAAAWSAGDGAAVDRLYAKSATVTDNLLGVAASGRAIGDLATGPPASGALAGMAVVALPHFGGPAVFAAGSTMDHEPMDQVGLILTTPEGAACPEQVAVWLTVDDHGLHELGHAWMAENVDEDAIADHRRAA